MGDATVVVLILITIMNGVYGLLPFVTPDTLQFGVRVPAGYVEDKAIRNTRKVYYAGWAVILVASFAILTLESSGSFKLGSEVTYPLWLFLIVMAAHYGNYYLARRRLMRRKSAQRWYEGYTESLVANTRMREETKRPSLLWGIPNAVVILCAFGIALIRYNALPSRIAVHFTASGAPNGFAAKSIWSVFGVLMIQAALLVGTVIVQSNLKRFPLRLDPVSPESSMRRYQTLVAEAFKAVWILLALVSLGTSLMLFPVWGMTASGHLGSVGMGLVLLGMVICVLWIAQTARRHRHADDAASKSRVVARDDDRYWVGGAIYFNPSDPSIFVSKRFGIGMTLNFGHPISWIALAVIVALPIVVHFVLKAP